MVNVFQTDEAVPIVCACKVLVDQDVNLDHHAQVIHVKMEVYVFWLASAIDAIVHQA